MTPRRRTPAKGPTPPSTRQPARKRPATPAAAPAAAPAAFPLRPPTWVRVWLLGLGVVAFAVAVGIGVPAVVAGLWAIAVPLLVLALLAGALVWRVGGIVARPTATGDLLVRNRLRTFRLTRADVASVRAGERPGRAGTPVAVVVLADGGEVAVDATLAANFQIEQLDAQVAALHGWLRG